MHPITRGPYFEEVPPRHFDGRNLARGQADEIREKAADDASVPNNKKVFLLTLELDEDGLQPNWYFECQWV